MNIGICFAYVNRQSESKAIKIDTTITNLTMIATSSLMNCVTVFQVLNEYIPRHMLVAV